MSHYCGKCNRTMDDTQFYTSKNIDKYPDGGKLNECKKCITLHVDNFDPETFVPILEETDIPYIPEEWNKILLPYKTNQMDIKKLTGMTILGRYLSKMKLKQWKDYSFADSEKIVEDYNNKKIAAMKIQGFSGQQIEEAVSTGSVITDKPEGYGKSQESAGTPEYQEDLLASDYFIDDLTDEDKRYLTMKWGRTYRSDEWVKLEQLYQDMVSSYDIQTAGHIDTLKMICKTSLKANQLIDMGDVEGFQKMSKVYDNLMKSGKFTAAQNKAESGEFVDSIGELVAICETVGFIPRYYVDGPADRVDKTLEDLKGYTRSLITEEMNLGNLVENSLKEMARQESRPEDDDENEDIELEDSDFITRNDFIEEQKDEDQQRYDAEMGV